MTVRECFNLNLTDSKATTDADIARQIAQDPDTTPDLGTDDDSTFAARRAYLAATSAAE